MSSPDPERIAHEDVLLDLTRPASALRSETGPYFGDFGGRFLPEALVPALDELIEAIDESPSLPSCLRSTAPRAGTPELDVRYEIASRGQATAAELVVDLVARLRVTSEYAYRDPREGDDSGTDGRPNRPDIVIDDCESDSVDHAAGQGDE